MVAWVLQRYHHSTPPAPQESFASVMFILKRQDVEISSIQHPKREQQIPILTYQGQTFRLISVFSANQAEEAKPSGETSRIIGAKSVFC
jgi:hypothetical protein